MRINSNDIVCCPSCGAQQLQMSWDTYTSYGVKYYTDGKKTDSAPYYPYYIKCPECKVFFKTKNCVTKGKEGFRKSYGGPPQTKFLSADEYLAAVSEGIFNAEQDDILNLRIELWRKFNDRVRNTTENAPEVPELFESEDEKKAYCDNCRRLLRLLEEFADDESYLRRAELLRNLGEFNKCRQVLDMVKDTVKYAEYIGVIKKLCDEGNIKTAEIKQIRGEFCF